MSLFKKMCFAETFFYLGYIHGGITDKEFLEMWVERGYKIEHLVALKQALDAILAHTYVIKARP